MIEVGSKVCIDVDGIMNSKSFVYTYEEYQKAVESYRGKVFTITEISNGWATLSETKWIFRVQFLIPEAA